MRTAHPKRVSYRPPNELLLIPKGVRLQGCCTEYSLAKVFREDRLVLSFQIITEGEYFGKSLQWWFGGIEVRKKGDWRPVSMTGKYVRSFYLAHPDHPRMTRRDRFAISTWGDKVYELVPRQVKSNNSQTPLPEQCIYSVIDYVLPEGTRRSAKEL